MPLFTYPATDADRPDQLLTLLGSHWADSYGGRDLIREFLAAQASRDLQTWQNLTEARQVLARSQIPVWHQERWRKLTLRASLRNNETLQYQADGQQFGDGTQYGELLREVRHGWVVDKNIRDISLLTNRLTQPSASYVAGLDFYLEDGRLIFLANPFDNELFPQTPVYADGEVVDFEISLWARSCYLEQSLVYEHAGFLLGIQRESSEAYKDFVNAVLDAWTAGTSCQKLAAAVSAIVGLPVVATDGEVVEVITTDRQSLLIITDRNVYAFDLTDEALVAVGDVLAAGQQLTRNFQILEFRDGQVTEEIPSLHLSRGWISHSYRDGLGFDNREVPLQVSTDDDGITRVEFALGGFPADIEDFWDQVHAAGKSSTTLARLLDVRGTDATTEPTADSLPATVNPLQFLIANLLRYHTFLVRIRVGNLQRGLGLDLAYLLRQVVPPWTAVLFLFELEFPSEVLELTDVDGDSLDWAIGGDPLFLQDVISLATLIAEQPRTYLLQGACE